MSISGGSSSLPSTPRSVSDSPPHKVTSALPNKERICPAGDPSDIKLSNDEVNQQKPKDEMSIFKSQFMFVKAQMISQQVVRTSSNENEDVSHRIKEIQMLKDSLPAINLNIPKVNSMDLKQ